MTSPPHSDPRPIAVLELDAARLPPALAVPPGHARAQVLVRWRGRPVGELTLDSGEGIVQGTRLDSLVASAGGAPLRSAWLAEWLGWDPSAAAAALPTATVAVCTRDRPDDLERCLAAIDALDEPPLETLVVDSASSTSATREVVARHPRARYLREERPGLDVARNRALREAGGELVAFVDDDAAPDPGWLAAIRRAFADARTLCVTGLTLPMELETPAQRWFERTNAFGRGFVRRRFDGTLEDPFDVARIGAGVNMAIRRGALDLVGPFDEALDAGTPTRSGGDHDMFSRILAGGWVILYEPGALVRHRHRSEWAALREAVRGYGTGVYAHLTKQLLAGELRAPLVALGWLRTQLPALLGAALRQPGHVPLDLAAAELRGCLAGPLAYLRARRAARARAS